MKLSVLVDGVAVEVELAHGDYVRAERDGHRFAPDEPPSAEANANLTFHALSRAKRRGLIAVDIPATFEDYLDIFENPEVVKEPEVEHGGND